MSFGQKEKCVLDRKIEKKGRKIENDVNLRANSQHTLLYTSLHLSHLLVCQESLITQYHSKGKIKIGCFVKNQNQIFLNVFDFA